MKKWHVVIENQFGELGDSHGPYEREIADALLPYEEDNLREGWKAHVMSEEDMKEVAE